MNFLVAITILAVSIPVFAVGHGKNDIDSSYIWVLFVTIGLVLFIIVSYKNRQNRFMREAEENVKREAWIKQVKLDSKGLIVSCIAILLNGGLIGFIIFGFIGYLFSELWMYISSGIAGILWIYSCGIIGFILGLIFSYRHYYEYYHHFYFLCYCYYFYYRNRHSYDYDHHHYYYGNDNSERLNAFKGNKQIFISLSLLIIIIVGRFLIVERYKELRAARLIQNLSEEFLGLFNWLSGLFHGLSGLFHGLLHKLSDFFGWLYLLFHFLN